jgi:hypothetical protein
MNTGFETNTSDAYNSMDKEFAGGRFKIREATVPPFSIRVSTKRFPPQPFSFVDDVENKQWYFFTLFLFKSIDAPL